MYYLENCMLRSCSEVASQTFKFVFNTKCTSMTLHDQPAATAKLQNTGQTSVVPRWVQSLLWQVLLSGAMAHARHAYVKISIFVIQSRLLSCTDRYWTQPMQLWSSDLTIWQPVSHEMQPHTSNAYSQRCALQLTFTHSFAQAQIRISTQVLAGTELVVLG